MRLLSLLVVSAALATARSAWAGECTCDNWRAACSNIGACCGYGSQCGGSSAPAAATQSFGRTAVERGASALTSGFVDWLFSPKPAPGPSPDAVDPQQQLQEQRLRERRALEERQEEERRQAAARKKKFDESKRDFLSDWQGGAPQSSAEAAAPDKLDFNWDAGESKKAASEYHERAEERSRGLWKGDCWKNVPLPPHRPIKPVPDDEYRRMVARYQLRRRSWQAKCLNAAPTPAGEADGGANLNAGARAAAREDAPGSKTALTGACSDCLGVYNHEAGACESPAVTDLLAYSDCLNRAAGVFKNCSDPCAR